MLLRTWRRSRRRPSHHLNTLARSESDGHVWEGGDLRLVFVGERHHLESWGGCLMAPVSAPASAEPPFARLPGPSAPGFNFAFSGTCTGLRMLPVQPQHVTSRVSVLPFDIPCLPGLNRLQWPHHAIVHLSFPRAPRLYPCQVLLQALGARPAVELAHEPGPRHVRTTASANTLDTHCLTHSSVHKPACEKQRTHTETD